MERIPAQPSFIDLALADLGSPRAKAFFALCDKQIPLQQLADSILAIFPDENSQGGAPHLPIVQMLKIAFVQKCFGLSDPGDW
jgi:hypothetical protein